MLKSVLHRLHPRLKGGGLRIAIALFFVVGASAMFWASQDFTVVAPDWDGLVHGVTYNPSHVFSERESKHITPERIAADMLQLSRITGHVRTYTVAGGLDKVPEIARRYGLTVSLGIWIDADLNKNEREIETAIKVILANRRVIDRVIVGNESIQFGNVTPEQLNSYIQRVRDVLPARIKVTTAETWSSWLLHPELGQNVDIVFVHILPYWEGTDVRSAMVRVQHEYKDIQNEFPDKPVVIGEIGWPSEGRTKGAAEASLANQAYFIRNFVQLALNEGYDYYIVEAYDQPWKTATEGVAGAHWGLFEANGDPKFGFTGLLRSFPEWRFYTFLAAILTLVLGLLILVRMPRVRQPGYLVMGGLVAAVTTGVLMLVDATTLDYIDPADLAMVLAMSPLVLLASVVILTEGVELVASLWRVERRALRVAIPESSPRVCVHVPCYNEPPLMVCQTLDALAALDYDNFEVIVLDNNTPDPETWKPVEAHCAALGARFRFYHFDAMTGFKAGALNEALELTGPDANTSR